MHIHTIGHSNHTESRFLELLQMAGIQMLVDTRSVPASRFAPFTRPARLERALADVGIRYLYLGDRLGGRPEEEVASSSQQPVGKRRAHRPDYDAMRQEPEFQHGIERLVQEARTHRACIMCAEEDPAACHRTLLIGPALKEQGVGLLHIRGDGAIHDDEDLAKIRSKVPTQQIGLALVTKQRKEPPPRRRELLACHKDSSVIRDLSL